MTGVRNAAKWKTRAVKSNAAKGKQRKATSVPEGCSKVPTSTRGVGKATEGTRQEVKSIQEERTLKSGRTTRQQKSMTIESSTPTGRASVVVQVRRSSEPGHDFSEPAVEEEEGSGDKESQVGESRDKQRCDATVGDGGHGPDTFPVAEQDPASSISNYRASRTSVAQGHRASALEHDDKATQPHSEEEGDCEQKCKLDLLKIPFKCPDKEATNVEVPSWFYNLSSEEATNLFRLVPGLKEAYLSKTIPALTTVEVARVTAGLGMQGVMLGGIGGG
jgi:hypothetical protein